jgi:NAD(P) transhydrogenase
VEGVHEAEHRTLTGDFIVIATGTTPRRPEGVDFDQERVLDSDEIVNLDFIPTSMVVAGAGVIGIEYASIFAALGTKVTVVEKRPSMLDFVDSEIVEALTFHLRDLAVTFRFGEEVTGVEIGDETTLTTLASGKRIAADTVMYSAGRQGLTDTLDLKAAGLEADKRGRLDVGDDFRTSVDHIFAVGDVIGFPALAATSMDQGRLAAYQRLRRALQGHDRAAADRHLLHSRGVLRRRHRGRSHPWRWRRTSCRRSRERRPPRSRRPGR